MREVLRLCVEQVPTFGGIKYSGRELANFESAMMDFADSGLKLMVGTVDEVSIPSHYLSSCYLDLSRYTYMHIPSML